MPAAFDIKQIKHLLAVHFPTCVLESPYLGAMKPLKLRCKTHGDTFYSTWNKLQIQISKGKGGHSLCPSCVKERKPVLMGEKNPAHIDASVFQDRLDAKFGKGILKIVKYSGMNKPATLLHTCGLSKSYKRANYGLGQVYPCACVRTQALIPFTGLTKDEQRFIAFCYSNLSYSVEQISELTGVFVSTVRKVLAEQKVQLGKNTTNGKRRTLEGLQGRPLSNFKLYVKLANMVTNYVVRAYKDLLDPDDKRSYDWHIDHMLSKADAYRRPVPLDLRVLCHPANLRLTAGAENIRKNSKSSISIGKLKKRIKKFESAHGKVLFPTHLRYEVDVSKTSIANTEGLRVLGLDPGTKNFGVFGGELIGVKTLHNVRPLVSTMFKNTVTSFVTDDLGYSIEQFKDELWGYLETVNPDIIIVERFQTRGLMGTTVELIGFMIGLIGSIASTYAEQAGKAVMVKAITASQWKNALNKKTDLSEIYNILGNPKYHHQADALLMSLYAFPDKDVYDFLTEKRQQVIATYVRDSH